MSDWQPIETAPKDIELILLYQDGYGVRAGYWDDVTSDVPCWFAAETQLITAGKFRPTHWMPLPAAPKVTP